MYEKMYALPDVMCVSSNNPVDWMVVYYHAVMLHTESDRGSYIVAMPKQSTLPFEGEVVGFTESIKRSMGVKM